MGPSVAGCYGPEAIALTLDRPRSEPYRLVPTRRFRIDRLAPTS